MDSGPPGFVGLYLMGSDLGVKFGLAWGFWRVKKKGKGFQGGSEHRGKRVSHQPTTKGGVWQIRGLCQQGGGGSTLLVNLSVALKRTV